MSISNFWRNFLILICIIICPDAQALLSNKNFQATAGEISDSEWPKEVPESEANPEFSGIPDQVFEKYFQNVLAREFAAEYKARQARKQNSASKRSGPIQEKVIGFHSKHNSVTRAPIFIQFNEGTEEQKPDRKQYRSKPFQNPLTMHIPRSPHSTVHQQKPTVTPQKMDPLKHDRVSVMLSQLESEERPRRWKGRPINRRYPFPKLNKFNSKRSMPKIGEESDHLDHDDDGYKQDATSTSVTEPMREQRFGTYNFVHGRRRPKYPISTSVQMQSQTSSVESQPNEFPSPTLEEGQGRKYHSPTSVQMRSHRRKYPSPLLTLTQAQVHRTSSSNPSPTTKAETQSVHRKYPFPLLTYSRRHLEDEAMSDSVRLYRPTPQTYEEPTDSKMYMYSKRPSIISSNEPSSRVSIFPHMAAFLIASDRSKRNSNVFEQYSAEEDPKAEHVPQPQILPFDEPRNPTVIRFKADTVQDMPRSFRTALGQLLKARLHEIEGAMSPAVAGYDAEFRNPATEDVQVEETSTTETIFVKDSTESERIPIELDYSNEDEVRSTHLLQPDYEDTEKGQFDRKSVDFDPVEERQRQPIFRGFKSSLIRIPSAPFEHVANSRNVQGRSAVSTFPEDVNAPDASQNPAPPTEVQDSIIAPVESLNLYLLRQKLPNNKGYAPPTFSHWKARMASIPRRSSGISQDKDNPTSEIETNPDSTKIEIFSKIQRPKMPTQRFGDTTDEIIIVQNTDEDVVDSTSRSQSVENDDQTPSPVAEQTDGPTAQPTTDSVHPAASDSTTSVPADSASSSTDRMTSFSQDSGVKSEPETKGQTEAVEPVTGSHKVKRSVEEGDADPRAMTFSMMDGDSNDFQELSPKAKRRAFACSVNTRMGREACKSICQPEGMAVICAGPYCNCFKDTKDESADAERNSGKCGPNTNFGRSNCRTLCNGVDDLITCSEVNCYCNRHKNVNKGNPLMDGMGRVTTGILGQFFYCGPANGINQCSDICRGWGHVSCGELSCYCDRGGS